MLPNLKITPMKKILHYLIITLLSIMFLFLIVSLFKPTILEPIIEWIKIQIEWIWKWNYLLAFVSALAESLPIIGTIIPWQVVMISVWWFYGSTWLSQFLGVLFFAIIWSVISNAIWYFLWKKYGEWFFEKYWMWIWIQETELKYLKKWVATWWAWWIILSKFHPHFRAFLPFIAGSMGFKQTRFWIFNIIASSLWAIVFISIGIFFAEYYEVILKYIWWFLFWWMICVWWYLWFFKKKAVLTYMKEKNAEIERKIK